MMDKIVFGGAVFVLTALSGLGCYLCYISDPLMQTNSQIMTVVGLGLVAIFGVVAFVGVMKT